jgi:uncharacterized protein related to proFAR isomerase
MPVFGHDFASKHTRLALDQDRVLEKGESVRIYGFIISNCTASPQTVDITDFTRKFGQDHFYIAELCILGNTSFESDSRWLADHGVRALQSAAGVSITFFHSSGGA